MSLWNLRKVISSSRLVCVISLVLQCSAGATDKPQVQIAWPESGAEFAVGESVECKISLGEVPSGGGIFRVSWSAKVRKKGADLWFSASSETPPAFSVLFRELPPGNYTLHAFVLTTEPDKSLPLGPIDFAIRSPSVPHDNFSSRELLSGRRATRLLSTQEMAAATLEPNEPLDGLIAASFWFKWKAPADGLLSIDPGWSGVRARLFEGEALENLRPVIPDANRPYDYPVRAGHEYAIQQPAYWMGGTLTLELDTLASHPAPPAAPRSGIPILLDGGTTDDSAVEAVEFYANERLLGTTVEPPFHLWCEMEPGLYDFRAVHHFNDGDVVEVRLFSNVLVLPANSVPEHAAVVTTREVKIDTRGFSNDYYQANGGFYVGAPLYYRIKPDQPLYLFSTTALIQVAHATNQNQFLSSSFMLRADKEPPFVYQVLPGYLLAPGVDYLLSVERTTTRTAGFEFIAQPVVASPLELTVTNLKGQLVAFNYLGEGIPLQIEGSFDLRQWHFLERVPDDGSVVLARPILIEAFRFYRLRYADGF